jgi:glycosyltransferase involved in cell wall biosynthesis
MPFELPLGQRSRVSRALAEFVTGSYDLVWCFRVRAWVLAGEPALAPSVVDLDDLEDQKIRARLSSAQADESDALSRLRHVLGAAFWSADARRWQRLHERIASRSSATVVCSELDATRSAIPRVRVIPNGYEPPDHPVGHLEVRSPPTVLFHGTLRYPPNADAARFLVEDVSPRLRALVPDVRIRLAGLASDAVAALDHPPEVTVVGQVPDITTELASADVVVVPMRFASGTRVKILEAFAHRVPVVSTTCGAEGLGVQDGVHLLIADEPDSLARALAASLTDSQLREKLVTNAHAIFVCNYRSESIREMVTALAKEVAGR